MNESRSIELLLDFYVAEYNIVIQNPYDTRTASRRLANHTGSPTKPGPSCQGLLALCGRPCVPRVSKASCVFRIPPMSSRKLKRLAKRGEDQIQCAG